jgi:hypothetical protein
MPPLKEVAHDAHLTPCNVGASKPEDNPGQGHSFHAPGEWKSSRRCHLGVIERQKLQVGGDTVAIRRLLQLEAVL